MSTSNPRDIDDIERGQLTSPFGRDLGLLHELLVTTRNKQNLGRAFWRLLHEDSLALSRAVEAALTFPTQIISPAKALCPISELIKDCLTSTEQHYSNAYTSGFEGEVVVDEGEDVTYSEDTIPLSLYRTPRETSVRDVEHHLVGLHYRPARLAETLIYAHTDRKLDCTDTNLLCLQTVSVNGRDGRINIYKHLGSPRGGNTRSIDLCTTNKVEAYTLIPCIKLPRLKK